MKIKDFESIANEIRVLVHLKKNREQAEEDFLAAQGIRKLSDTSEARELEKETKKAFWDADKLYNDFKRRHGHDY